MTSNENLETLCRQLTNNRNYIIAANIIMTNNAKFPLMRMTTSFRSQGEKSVNEESNGG
jgi:hypothetical protein